MLLNELFDKTHPADRAEYERIDSLQGDDVRQNWRGGNEMPDEKRLQQKNRRDSRRLAGRNDWNSTEEEESKLPAIRDRVHAARSEPNERGAEPSVKRQGQRGGRRLRQWSGRGNPSKNAMDYHTPNELNHEEEEETKKQANRDRQVTIKKWIKDVNSPVPLSRIKSQENRLNRRLYGK